MAPTDQRFDAKGEACEDPLADHVRDIGEDAAMVGERGGAGEEGHLS